MSGAAAWQLARSAAALVVPVFPEQMPFGPQPAREIVLSLVFMTVLCAVAGHFLTRSTLLLQLAAHFHSDLRDEAWDHMKLNAVDAQEAQAQVEEADQKDDSRRLPRKRTATELLFITVHNSAVSVLAALAWATGSPALARHAFTLEVAYEIFDTYSLRLQRLEPETLIHHIVSPICILCSMQTDVDFRVLCHLCVCIDVSGAFLGYSKFLLHYAHVSSTRVYRNLMWIYGVLRVVLPLIDTVIIIRKEIAAHGGVFAFGALAMLDHNETSQVFPQTDWTQLYFWAIAVLNAFNVYFSCVIRARANMPPHIIACYEARTGCR